MINRKEIVKEEKSYELISIICDVCKKEFPNDNDHIFDIQEFHHIHFTGGYGSQFGDMSNIRCNICDSCFKEMLKDYWYEVDDDGNVLKENEC